MIQQSWFDNPENKAKVLRGIEEKAVAKQEFTDEVWTKACQKFNSYVFPDKLVEEKCLRNPNYNSSLGEMHEENKQFHSLQTYCYEQEIAFGLTISWKYSACPTCKKLINKSGTLLHPYKSMAYRRVFVRSGLEDRTPPTLAINERPAQSIQEIFDGDLLSSFKGVNR